ncbi:MAG: hypothetical protein R3F47_12140 [Gammaproteobacteria bacterium]
MRLNLSSLATSWILALGFLATIGVWTQPSVSGGQSKTLVELTGLQQSGEHMELDRIKATAWCALESRQIAVLKLPGQELRVRGSMALAPGWQGEPLQQQDQRRIDNCISLRLQDLHRRANLPASERSAIGFLFPDRQ